MSNDPGRANLRGASIGVDFQVHRRLFNTVAVGSQPSQNLYIGQLVELTSALSADAPLLLSVPDEEANKVGPAANGFGHIARSAREAGLHRCLGREGEGQ